MVWKGKLPILSVWIVAAGIGAAIVARLPMVYSAGAMVLVESPEVPEKYVSSSVSLDVQDRMATLKQQILSGPNLQKIIDEFGLFNGQPVLPPEERYETLRGRINIRAERSWTGNRTGAFRVSYEGANPAQVAQVANRIANLFIEGNLKTRETLAVGTSEFLNAQLDEAKKKLDSLESALSAYKTSHNGELPQQENALIGTLQQLRAETRGADEAINRAQQTKAVLENSLAIAQNTLAELEKSRGAGAAAAPVSANRAEPVAAPRLSQAIEAQMEQLRLRYSDQHPELRRLAAELVRVKRLEAVVGSTAKAAVAAPKTPAAANVPAPAGTAPRQIAEAGLARERVANLRAQLAALEQDIAKAREGRDKALRDITRYQARLEMMPVREQEIGRLLRDYDTSKTNYTSLLNKKLSAGMAMDLERRQKSEKFTIIDGARVPEKPDKPNRPVLFGMALAGGLVLGIALAVGNELRRGVLLGEWELPAHVPVLARMPIVTMTAPVPDVPATRGGKHAAVRRKWRPAVVSLMAVGVLAALLAGALIAGRRF